MEIEEEINIEWDVEPTKDPIPRRPRKSKCSGEKQPWLAQDIVKAARLLHTPEQNITFQEEQEMRRIFSLLYDVFRYKTVLKDALDQTGFSHNCSEYKLMWPVVWLLFYDLYKRKFLPREHEDESVCRDAFSAMGLAPVEDDLWKYRVRLAAALARNRVAHRALHLDDLLPPHLRDERLIAVDLASATAWCNAFILSKSEIVKYLEEIGILLEPEEDSVRESSAKMDHVCPKVLLIPATLRNIIASSHLVTSGKLIFQDRAFCLSASYMSRLVTEVSLRGTIAQSHVISPRATAYLANVLRDNRNVDKVLAFGSGPRQKEYEDYFTRLGVNNCEVFSERFSSVPPDSPLLQNVVAVLASPPTSWTGVADPVDLVCSRSGDMAMLRALTQARRGRDVLLFEQQRDTLRFAMSLPQVQLLLYESHSTSNEENLAMVQSAVRCMNEWARQKHAEEQRIQHQLEEDEEKKNKAFLPGGTPAQREQREREALEALEAQAQPVEIEVPGCDLFEITPLPFLCDHGTQCVQEDGCFLSRIQRKEIIGLDAKYMIKIAEARGLFGNEPGHKKSSTARTQKKKEEIQRKQSTDQTQPRRTRINLERLSEHTHASLMRVSSSDILPCERYSQHVAGSWQRRSELRGALTRLWWREAIRAISRLLPRERLTPRSKAAATPFPPLRLPRVLKRRPFPIHTVQLPIERQSEPDDGRQLSSEYITEIRRNSC